jgi:pantoate--beta-alanine ligase
MRIITTIAEAHESARTRGVRRVLVPTMGALHQGHIELVRIARAAAGPDGEVAVSIFVNPLQFEPGADYERYPRPEADDDRLCADAGADLVFRPSPAEMYHEDRSVFVDEHSLGKTLCGASRPGHFRGVCTVVTKLFHLLAPHAAVFGEKDFQQLAIIRRMVRDLDFPIEIIGAPTVREPDGLAVSSRNQYLSADERAQAPVIRAGLLAAAAAAEKGETLADKLLLIARTKIRTAPLARIDYLELVHADTLQPQRIAGANSVVAAAVFFGRTRLIDNLRLG